MINCNRHIIYLNKVFYILFSGILDYLLQHRVKPAEEIYLVTSCKWIIKKIYIKRLEDEYDFLLFLTHSHSFQSLDQEYQCFPMIK